MSEPIYDKDKDRFEEARRVQSEETDSAYQKYQEKHVDEDNPDSQKNFKDAFDHDEELRDSKDTVDKAEKDEIDALNSQLEDEVGGLDDEGEDYFKTSEGKLKSASFTMGFLRGGGSNKKRNAIIASMAAATLLSVGGFLGFLNTFRLKSFMENVNFNAFSRYNAAIDRRSDAWSKAYFRTRLLEWDGTTSPDSDGNTFFRSNKIDTDHPFTDWYRTMRTSKFEQNLLEKHGIRFVSIVREDGSVRAGRIDISGKTVDIIPDGIDGDLVYIDDLVNDTDKGKFDRLLGGVEGKIVEVFDTDKDARKALKKAIDSETHKWQVIKRRHTRKAIANMAGVRDWRFFDKSRTKYESKKAEFQEKMIKKVFPKDGKSGQFLLCILALGGCRANTDPNNPENKNVAPTGAGADRSTDDPVDTDGDGIGDTAAEIDGSDYNGASKLAREAAEKGAEEALEEGIEVTEKQFRKKLIDSITKQFTGTFGGGGPGAIKKVLDWALKFETNLGRNGTTGRSKIGDAVFSARRESAVLAFAALGIIVAQAQSGEVDPAQLNEAMQFMNGLGQSEAMQFMSTGEGFPENVSQTRGVASNYSNSILEDFLMGTAMAQGASEADASELVNKCKTGEPFDSDDVVPLCDNLKPNGGSRISGLEDAWNKYVTNSPLGDIISGYKSLKNNAITGFFMDIADVLGDAASAVITPILEATGLGNVIGDVAGWLAERVLAWVGVMPCMTGTEAVGGMPANCVLAGGAGVAEGSARAAGGILSAVGSSSYLYSKQLAIDYMKEQSDFMSTSERYFSLNSPQSLASQLTMKLSADTSLKGFASLFGMKQVVSGSMAMFGSIFQGKALAADNDGGFKDVAGFAGMDRYSIPKACIDLDPAGEDYLEMATNSTTVPKDAETLGSDVAFSAALYSQNGDDLDEQELENISNTYNCMALDNVVKGGLGYMNGFEDDDGYTSAESNTVSGPAGSFQAGVAPEWAGHENDNCPVGGPGSIVDTAKGKARLCDVRGYKINVVMASAFDSMYNDMAAAGFNVQGNSGNFRSFETQTQMHAESPNSTAPPGKSNHEFGLAVDTSCSGTDGSAPYTPWMPGKSRGLQEFQRAITEHPCLNWLHTNSSKYGLLLQCDGKGKGGGEIAASTGGCETWHLSPTGG